MVAGAQEVPNGGAEANEIVGVRRQSLEAYRKATVPPILHNAVDGCSEVLADMLREYIREIVAHEGNILEVLNIDPAYVMQEPKKGIALNGHMQDPMVIWVGRQLETGLVIAGKHCRRKRGIHR
ncbi:hypothetical protein CS8_054350 [Cupriavidus sp. 8B]